MKRKPYELTTTRLYLVPDEPADLWNCKWTIMLKNDRERQLGYASFAGEKVRGCVPVYVELKENYRNQGYGTEVFRELVDFAFLHQQIYEVTAVTEHENDACVMAMEKAGFVYRGKDGKIESYSIKRPKTNWLGLYLFIGIIEGLVIGIMIGNSWIGLAIGLFIGMVIGLNMDGKVNKERKRIVGKTEQPGEHKKEGEKGNEI